MQMLPMKVPLLKNNFFNFIPSGVVVQLNYEHTGNIVIQVYGKPVSGLLYHLLTDHLALRIDHPYSHRIAYFPVKFNVYLAATPVDPAIGGGFTGKDGFDC